MAACFSTTHPLPVIDHRLEPVLSSAVGRIQSAAQAAASKVVESLGLALMSATSGAIRQSLTAAQFDLRAKMASFNQTFSRVLLEKVMEDVRPKTTSTRGGGAGLTDWASLSLVGDDEVEQLVSAERLGQELGQGCEWELRDLLGYMGTLQGLRSADQDRNPLRPQNIGKALFRAIEVTSEDAEIRKVLAKELGRTLAQDMRAVYQAVIDDIRQRGVQPLSLAVRGAADSRRGDLGRDTVSGRGLDASGTRDAGASAHTTRGGHEGSGREGAAPRAGYDGQAARALSAMFGVSVPAGLASAEGATTSAGSFARSGPGGLPSLAGLPSGDEAARGPLIDVIKRLAFASMQSGAPGTGAGAGGAGGGAGLGSDGAAGPGQGLDWAASVPGGLSGDALQAGAAGGLMAVNMIRAHRDELVRASTGTLDHMVIDIVAALFDQVLSDPKVPPQMAREIARLQLPVLRVALKDMGFFSSRKHPVRRFVNRIASLAASFDDFDGGAGQECLKRVNALVQQVVEGDFDQMELYEETLSELEAFIRDQTALAAAEHAEVSALLGGKEADLRVQQRYMRALQAQLASLGLQDFLRDFLAQVWSQVQVLVASREGGDSALAQRMRQVGRELVQSVQPKGSPQLRKEFLLKLPALMKDLNEGLDLIRWPDEAKKTFFSQLLPAHAESLKAPPLTDFSQRQLKFQLDQVDKVAIPTRDEVAKDTAPITLTDEATGVVQLTSDEAQGAGLVDDAAIDWDGSVDIDLSAAEPGAVEAEALAEVDINLDTPAPPVAGPQLISHIQPGVAYQMYLSDSWKKVRLSWVSPGRTFFIFTYGRMYKQTITVTSRTLSRLCDSQRFRAYENAELIERATARARKQLAALTLTGGAASNTTARATL